MTIDMRPPSPALNQEQSKPVNQAPLWLLALITFSGTVAMHMFVPALPSAARYFQISSGVVQLTLSAYILGLAVGQLFYGPISDRYGRKNVLLGGIALFTAGSVTAWTANSIDTLIIARFIQALGGCSGLVLGKAIILDSVKGAKATQRLALLNMIVIAGPGLAPVIGMLLVKLDGWRTIFAVLSVFGLGSLMLIGFLLPKGNTGGGLPFRVLAFNYVALLKTSRFWAFSLAGSLATTSLYAYIAVAPFIFIRDMHTSENEMALFLALNIFGAWVGSTCVSRLIVRVPAKRLLQAGLLMSFAAVILLGSMTLFTGVGKYTLVGLMMVFTLGSGIVSPVAISEALNVDPRVAASASGIYGFTQMGVGALASYCVTFGGNPLAIVTIVLMISLSLALLCLHLAYRPSC